MKRAVYLLMLCMELSLAGCGESQENKKAVSKNISSTEENKNDIVKFQIPKEGNYNNDSDEILKIKKENDGIYNIIEYSITHLLYVENAIGTYNSKTGILEFKGKDDRGNDIKAEIINKGDYLEVTVTQSSYNDIIGMKQKFFLN